MEVVGRENAGHSQEGLATTGYARALYVCEEGTLLTHDGTDAVSNFCVAKWTSAWQYAGTGDDRRRLWSSSTPGTEKNRQCREYNFAIG